MKYVAEYKITPEMVSLIIESVNSIIRNSHYYSMYCGGGSGLVDRNNDGNQWSDYVTIKHFDGYIPYVELSTFSISYLWLEKCAKNKLELGWLTSSKNYEGILISPDMKKLTLTRNGRRHGITGYFNWLSNYRPSKVITYESMRPDENPFSYGLLPPKQFVEKEVLCLFRICGIYCKDAINAVLSSEYKLNSFLNKEELYSDDKLSNTQIEQYVKSLAII